MLLVGYICCEEESFIKLWLEVSTVVVYIINQIATEGPYFKLCSLQILGFYFYVVKNKKKDNSLTILESKIGSKKIEQPKRELNKTEWMFDTPLSKEVIKYSIKKYDCLWNFSVWYFRLCNGFNWSIFISHQLTLLILSPKDLW